MDHRTGLFGVFYYRSANPRTLDMLSQFLPVPADALAAEFAAGATLVCLPPLQPSPPAHDARRTSGLLTRQWTADQIGSLRGYWSSGVSGYQYFKWQFSHASWISEPAADNAAASFASIAVKTAPVAS